MSINGVVEDSNIIISQGTGEGFYLINPSISELANTHLFTQNDTSTYIDSPSNKQTYLSYKVNDEPSLNKSAENSDSEDDYWSEEQLLAREKEAQDNLYKNQMETVSYIENVIDNKISYKNPSLNQPRIRFE